MRSIFVLPIVFFVFVCSGFAQDAGEMAVCRRELWNVSPLTGWQTHGKDVGTEIANLRKGVRLGYVASRYNVERTIALVKTMQARKPNAEVKRYVDFLQREYLARARRSAGVYGIPNGKACFNALIHRYTSASINSDQLDSIAHDLRARASRVATATSPLRFPTTDAVLAHADSLLRRAWSATPQWFADVPNEPTPRVEIWPDADPNGASAIYIPATDTSGAKILINAASVMNGDGGLYLDRLIFHESVPGHHLQAIYAKRAKKAASATPNTAFVEGWAVYASNLADEMGLYTSESTRAPVNNSLMDDAVTFLVQAGLHVHRWTPQQAVDTIMKLSGVPREEADQQVQYFLAAPAHALAYPVGARTIEQLRDKARQQLGDRFDIRQFHRVLLERGPMPLSTLTSLVNDWVKAQQAGLAGTWNGYWARNGDTMRITLNVRPDTGANRFRATFDAERLRVSGIPFADVQLRGCCDLTMTLRGDRTSSVFTGTLHGNSMSGTFDEAGSKGTFAYERATAAKTSYEEREVSFFNKDVKLAGTLLTPTNGRSNAAVVFLHGSGAEGRWASRFLALQLARRGVAALIYDKRGVAGSSGDWRRATLTDLADDATAAIEFVRHQTGIDSKRVGIHGHSQGGTIAPLVAARAKGVAFIVGSAAAGTPTDSTEIYSILNSMNLTSAADSVAAKTYVSELVDVAYHGTSREQLDLYVTTFRDRSWFFTPPAVDNSYWAFSAEYGKYKPLEWWARVKVPVLLLYGGADQRVPANESAARIKRTLNNSGNNKVTVRIFPDADHTFRLAPGKGGWPQTAPDYLQTLTDWLQQR